jgi:hypothetical protein
LAGGLARAIDIKDHPHAPDSIRQPTRLLFVGVVGERAAEQIIEKQGAEGVNRL